MPKTITLRLDDDSYNKFSKLATADNRSISNLIETLALKKLNEVLFVDDFEMEEILSNKELLNGLKTGSKQARERKGKFIE